MASKFDVVQELERRFGCHVEVRIDSPPNHIFFLDGDSHWVVDVVTGMTTKPYPSGRVIVGHPEALNALHKRIDVAWPRVEVEQKIICGDSN